MKKMKILLFVNSFPYGNEEDTFIFPEVNYLNQKFDLTLISSASPEIVRENRDNIKKCGEINTIYYNENKVKVKIREWISFFFSQYFMEEIQAILREKKHCILRIKKSIFFSIQAVRFSKWLQENGVLDAEQHLLLYSYWFDYHVLGSVIARNALLRKDNVNLITRTHGYDLYDERVEKGKRQPFKDIMNSFVDKIVFASEYGCRYYCTKYNCVDKCVVFRLGAPAAQKFPNAKLGKKNLRIVSCSSLVALKRVDLIIDMLACVKDVSIEWIHFGDGELKKDIDNYAVEKLKDCTNITYYLKGYVERKDIYCYYKEHYVDCFLTLSESEGGCPVSIQEAMAHGIPIIGTDVGGITEMIDGNGILLSSSPSVEEIVAAVRTLHEMTENEIRQLRNRSIELWNKNFVNNDNAKKFTEYLWKLMDGKKGNE